MQEGQAMLPGAPKIYAAIAGVINDIGVVSKHCAVYPCGRPPL